MFLYLLALLIMSLGVSIVVFGQFKLVISRGHMSQYDAGGFYFIVQIVVIYLLVSLAYFWGETRFGAISDDLHPSYIGVLFVLCSSLCCLGYGLHNLNRESIKNYYLVIAPLQSFLYYPRPQFGLTTPEPPTKLGGVK